MKKILYYISAIVLFTFAYSCGDGMDIPRADQGNSLNAGFISNKLNYEVTESDNNQFKVTIGRGNTKGAADVEVKLILDSGVSSDLGFKLTSNTVSFADGVGSAEILVNYDLEKFGLTSSYSMTVELVDKTQGPIFEGTAYEKVNITVKRQLTFKNYKSGKGYFYSSLFGEGWEQTVEVAEEAPVIRLANCYYSGYSIFFLMDESYENILQFERQPMGHTQSGVDMTYMDLKSYTLEGNVLKIDIDFVVALTGGGFSTFGVVQETLTLPE